MSAVFSVILGSLFPLLFVVVILMIIGGGVYVVQQQTNVIIERLGKFNRICGPGVHVKLPFAETIAKRVNLRTDQVTFRIDAKTKDNVTITMDIAAQYHVNMLRGTCPEDSGVYRSYYMLVDPVAQMSSYLIDALRSAVPGYTLDEVFENKDSIANDANQTVSGIMIEYGYDLVSTLITSIGLPKDVEASMNRINSAQREQTAAQALAEAERIKVVTEARAQAEAMEQAGIGIAAQRKAIADGIADSLETIKTSGVSSKEANELFLFTQWTDMMEKFAKNGKQTTVVLPSDFNSTSGMFEQMLVANEADKNE
ncbi:MAG: SPFH domain-containing protein [Coriobacteriia bacterium]|nr:SPFH domain-containing protein [Coriobacteriia bacterium]